MADAKADPKDTKTAATQQERGEEKQATSGSQAPTARVDQGQVTATDQTNEQLRGLATKSVADRPLEAADETIDARLDNRSGRQRPPREDFPAKPQQIDGPEATDPVVRGHGRPDDPLDPRPRKGMHSPGDHGLGDTEVVPYDKALAEGHKGRR